MKIQAWTTRALQSLCFQMISYIVLLFQYKISNTPSFFANGPNPNSSKNKNADVRWDHW